MFEIKNPYQKRLQVWGILICISFCLVKIALCDWDPRYGPYFEGDMLFDPDEDPYERSFVGSDRYRWPSRIIPFWVNESLGDQFFTTVWNALVPIMAHTCVEFRILEGDQTKDHIYYTNKGSGCYSFVGRKGGRQDLNLGPGCLVGHVIQHETLHALGFWHEHTRSDRNDYIQVKWENIQDGKETNFVRIDDTRDFGFPYDFASIMQYNPYAFGKPGLVTLEPTGVQDDNYYRTKWNPMFFTNMSELDYKQLNVVFSC